MESKAGWLCVVSSLVLPLPALGAGVAELVARVSQANLSAHVAALEGERSAPAEQAAAAAYISGQLASWGYAVTTQPVGASENLIAAKPGVSLPDQVYVLGAHFDTVSGSPGADDDASGVAAVLEVARILASEPLGATVHFLFFALEEAGYQGSEAYAAALADAGTDVVGMISLDMVAYTCSTPGCQLLVPDFPPCFVTTVDTDLGTFIGAGSNTASLPLLDHFLADAAAFVPALEIETFTVQGTGTCFPDSRRSDHKSFWDEGYPALVLGDGAEARNPNYHQSTDTLATLDMAFAANVTRTLVAHLASFTSLAAVPSLSPAALLALVSALWAAAAAGLRARR